MQYNSLEERGLAAVSLGNSSVPFLLWAVNFPPAKTHQARAHDLPYY
jgi:hypothetical protein